MTGRPGPRSRSRPWTDSRKFLASRDRRLHGPLAELGQSVKVNVNRVLAARNAARIWLFIVLSTRSRTNGFFMLATVK